MQMIQCPNCGKLTGFKRSLGLGAFFMVLLTFGLWLLVIPIYPARCINCGLTRKSAVAKNIISWFRRGDTRSKVFIVVGAFMLLLFVAAIFNRNTSLQQSTASNVGGSSPTSTVVPAAKPSPSPTAPKSAVTQSTNMEDRELRLLPNPFGRGAVSDGRTYSVALISAYQSKIPPATELFVQGIIVGQTGPYAISMRDEQDGQKTLICGMSPEEFQDVSFLYHVGNRVQAYGEYVNASDGIPILQNCRVSDPTDRVVQLETVQASKIEPQSGEPNQGPAQTPSPLETAIPGSQGAVNDMVSGRKAAELGDAVAQYNLGVSYERGQGVAQDYVQAVYWYRKAAEQGYANAEYNLGGMYRNGQGVPKDYAQAADWWRRAAAQGLANAQDGLGSLYFLGQGVVQDYAQAAAWYRKAAEQGYAKAEYNLGVSYYFGQGVTQDYVQTVYWYRKAAEQGYANAEYNLGVSYEKGQGVPQDSAQAANWYRKATEHGYANAQ
jgi:hypothetical protein